MPKPLERRIREREHDARRRADKPWRKLYATARWRTIRADQLKCEPLCKACLSRGKVTPATVCHHVVRHQGDPVKFFAGPFASSCADCHDKDEQRAERGKPIQAIGADGWPVE